MPILTRRNFVKSAAMASTLPLLGRGAFADEPLKVGYIYLGPVGDFGWTWAHEKGRKAMVDHFGGKVVADYVENVNEDASATPVIKDLAAQGHKLIFTTSFGYMDQTLEVAKAYPDIKFEHCTGYKHAPTSPPTTTVSTRAAPCCGTIAGMMTKTGTIGYLGSFKVPEVVMGVNAFTLAAQAVRPDVKVKLVMIDSWFDPAKEAAATETLTNLGCDVVTAHTDSAGAAAGAAKRRRATASGRAPTCRASRRMRI